MAESDPIPEPHLHADRVMQDGDTLTAFDMEGEPLMSITARARNQTGNRLEILCQFFRLPASRMFLTSKGPRHPLSPLVEYADESDAPPPLQPQSIADRFRADQD